MFCRGWGKPMGHPCELFADERFHALLKYLTQCAPHSETTLRDHLRHLYPEACETCVDFAVVELLECADQSPDGPVFDADCVSIILHDWLACDDPHEPSDCEPNDCMYSVSWRPQ